MRQAVAPVFQHMLPAGRIGNRNKAKVNIRNYAKVCRSEKDEEPEEDEQQTEETPKRNFAMMDMMQQMPAGRHLKAAARKVLLAGNATGKKNIQFET